ncbi:MAG: hypothetical protein IKO68_10915 [Oscillospiraceae bacterium]|jgi:hypothetical protein|nr:hypothetical protein [Oscillospiraceae bacterium]
MGIKDDLKKAAYSAAPRKIEMNRSLTLEELYSLLEQHKDEFSVPFKLSSFLGKRIVFKREPRLEMQLLVTVKNNVITVRPNLQEGTIESGGFSVRTADLKNGFGLKTELNRDDYVNDVVAKITRIVNG